MGSSLQGASCTSGGVIRGKALGNVLSHEDAPEVFAEQVKSVKGEIRVFTSLVDPINLKPVFIVKVYPDPSLVQVLKQMGKKYKQLESKLSITFFDHLTKV
jgi:hypothetical protein